MHLVRVKTLDTVFTFHGLNELPPPFFSIFSHPARSGFWHWYFHDLCGLCRFKGLSGWLALRRHLALGPVGSGRRGNHRNCGRACKRLALGHRDNGCNRSRLQSTCILTVRLALRGLGRWLRLRDGVVQMDSCTDGQGWSCILTVRLALRGLGRWVWLRHWAVGLDSCIDDQGWSCILTVRLALRGLGRWVWLRHWAVGLDSCIDDQGWSCILTVRLALRGLGRWVRLRHWAVGLDSCIDDQGWRIGLGCPAGCARACVGGGTWERACASCGTRKVPTH